MKKSSAAKRPSGQRAAAASSKRRVSTKQRVNAKRAKLALALRALMRQDSDAASPQQVTGDHAHATQAPVLPRRSPPGAQGTLPAPLAPMDSVFELPSTFDATTVRTVHASLVLLAQQGSAVRLDGSKVEVVDAAAAQVLAALARAVGQVTVKVSPVLSDVLTVTAVGPLLSLEQ